jgi:hypothetical protein
MRRAAAEVETRAHLGGGGHGQHRRPSWYRGGGTSRSSSLEADLGPGSSRGAARTRRGTGGNTRSIQAYEEATALTIEAIRQAETFLATAEHLAAHMREAYDTMAYGPPAGASLAG